MTASHEECQRVVQRMTTSATNDSEWYNEWQQVIKSENEWQQVIKRVTMNNNEWQQMTTSDNKQQWVTNNDREWNNYYIFSNIDNL